MSMNLLSSRKTMWCTKAPRFSYREPLALHPVRDPVFVSLDGAGFCVSILAYTTDRRRRLSRHPAEPMRSMPHIIDSFYYLHNM